MTEIKLKIWKSSQSPAQIRTQSKKVIRVSHMDLLETDNEDVLSLKFDQIEGSPLRPGSKLNDIYISSGFKL